MKTFLTSLLTLALFVALSSTAMGHTYLFKKQARVATENHGCNTVYTVADYKRFGTRVYLKRRKSMTVSMKLHSRTLHKCQHSYRARKAVGRLHLKFKVKRSTLKQNWACDNYHPLACIALASRTYGTSYNWLVSCANSEGGTGSRSYKRMNTTGSGAGGIFQFMKSTFKATISRMGLSPKPWLTARWQAMAAAWKFRRDGTREWTGPGC